MSEAVSGSRERAAESLGVAADVPAAQARSAYLRRLAVEGFAPTEETVVAARLLTGTALPISPDGMDVAEQQAAQDIDAFAAAYWSLPPAGRRAKWSALKADHEQYPRAAARLRHLEAGLDFDTTPHPNPIVEILARTIRELYVLPVRDRAVRRAECLAEQSGPLGAGFQNLADAARRLHRDLPALAALEPGLMRRLTECSASSVVPVAAATMGAVDLSSDSWGSAVERRPAPSPQTYQTYQNYEGQSASAPSGSKIGWGGAAILVWILLSILRACTSTTSTTQPTRVYTPPPALQYQPLPAPPTGTGPLVTPIFTSEQLQTFEEYEKNPTGPAPEGYTLYKLLAEAAKRRADLDGTHRTLPTGRR